MPEIFDDLVAFQEWFEFTENIEDLNDEEEKSKLLVRAGQTSFVSDLHNILKPFLLRRTKDAGAAVFLFLVLRPILIGVMLS